MCRFEKPILALGGNPFVDYYLEKFRGIGYTFNSIDQMANFILDNENGLIKQHKLQYEDQIRLIRIAKKNLALNTISEELKKQLV